jgi:hypothetical protein
MPVRPVGAAPTPACGRRVDERRKRCEFSIDHFRALRRTLLSGCAALGVSAIIEGNQVMAGGEGLQIGW